VSAPGPDADLRLHLALLALAVAVMLLLGLPMGLVAVPLIAWVLSRWTVNGFSWLARRGEADALHDWNGRYFAFDDRQVRIHWDDRNIWVVADDVFSLLAMDPDATERRKIAIRLGVRKLLQPPGLKDECFSEEGLAKFLASLRRRNDAARIQAWFERQVFPMIRRRSG
jgi:hypothetical protein